MSNEEILKNSKIVHDYLDDMTSNLEGMSVEDSNVLFQAMNIMAKQYDYAYDDLKEQEKLVEFKCPRCGKELEVSDTIDYAYVCNDCDENFYSMEVE